MSPEVRLSIIPFGSRPLTSASGRAMDMLPSPTRSLSENSSPKSTSPCQ